MSTPIGKVLKGIVDRYGLTKALHKEKMPEYWAEVVGTRVASISNVRSFENGVLTVQISEPAWRTEITLRSQVIRQQLNTHIGEDVVEQIIIR